MRRAFTLIEMIVVVAAILVLMMIAFIGLRSIWTGGMETEAKARMQMVSPALLSYHTEFGYHAYSYGTDGVVSADDLFQELMPLHDLAGTPAGRSTRNYLNGWDDRWMAVGSDNQIHVVDPWGRPFMMQYDFSAKVLYMWSAGADGQYDISDDPVNGGRSSLFSDKNQALNNTPPVIDEAARARMDNDIWIAIP